MIDLFLPNIAYASVDTFIAKVNDVIINPLIVLLFALALVFFLYGMIEFLSNPDSQDKKTKGRSHMIWGIIGITIMMGVWFILNVVMNTFNIEGINPEEGTVKLNEYAPNYNWNP
jgi:uncharacterized membrane protein YidH (DUF202 family)